MMRATGLAYENLRSEKVIATCYESEDLYMYDLPWKKETRV